MDAGSLQGRRQIYRTFILLLILDGLFTRARESHWSDCSWTVLKLNNIYRIHFSFLMLTISNYLIFAVASKFIFVCCCQQLSAPIISMTSVFTWFPTIDTTESIDYVIICILATCLEQMCHLQLYWAHSIAILLWMTRNASITVRIVENWNAFIILHVILDFLRFTTNATSSVRPSQHIMHVYIYVEHLIHLPW